MAKTAVRQGKRRVGVAPAGGDGEGAATAAKNGSGRKARSGDPALGRLEEALLAAAAGDFEVRLPARRNDDVGRLEAAFNELAARNAALEAEVVRIAQIIGREGRMTERARLDSVGGGWSTAIESINGLIDDLVRPTTEVARVIVAVAEGDLSQKMALEIEGRPVKGRRSRPGRPTTSPSRSTSTSWCR